MQELGLKKFGDTKVAGKTPAQKQIPSIEELLRTYKFGADAAGGSYNAGEDSLISTDVASSNPNVLSVRTTPLKPTDITPVSPFPARGNQQDPVQSNTIPTPSRGSMQIDSAAIADAINAAQGKPSNFTNPDSQGVLSQLISDRAMGRGLYAVEPGLQLSPEQINARRNAADHFYSNQISSLIDKEKAQTSQNAMMGDLTPRQSSIVQQINSSIDSNPIVKQYVEMQSQYNNMLSSVGKGNGANDIATIYTFMKALDPDSVVREAEYDTGAKKSGNIFKGYMAQFNGMIDPNGGFVSPEAKQNILNTIKDRFAVKGQQYKNFRDQKIKQLELRGVPGARDFVTEYDFTFTDPQEREQVQQIQTGVNDAWNW